MSFCYVLACHVRVLSCRGTSGSDEALALALVHAGVFAVRSSIRRAVGPRARKNANLREDLTEPTPSGDITYRTLTHLGLSARCPSCNCDRDLHYLSSGSFDEAEAVRRLGNWARDCPGGVKSAHQKRGQRLLKNYAS